MKVRFAATFVGLLATFSHDPSAWGQGVPASQPPAPVTAVPATGPKAGTDWTGSDPLPFKEMVIGDVRLSSCEFDFQHAESLKRYTAQMTCEASSAPRLKVDRVVAVEFVVRHTRPDQPWFSLVSPDMVLPASGQATQMISNATGFYDSSLPDPDPNLNQIQVRMTVKSAITTTPTAMVPQYPGAAPVR